MSFQVNVEAETCEPTNTGFYQFYNNRKDGKKSDTVATYPIACTVIQSINSKATSATAANKINHNETTL
jgi:hypothetical protein